MVADMPLAMRIADEDDVAVMLLDRIIAVASGEPARNEVNEERAIGIWKRGVTL